MINSRKVFVDTSAWIALINSSDNLTAKAKQILVRLNQQQVILVTTDFVLLEVADALCKTHLRQQTYAYINGIKQVPDIIKIIPLEQSLLEEGWAIYHQYSDKDWGLTDCISFVVMRQEGITEAFTSDRHFEQAGFIKLM
ncbi:MAG: type II toxin-antitoxin system VapC family toxin [Okeania sp. SIO3B3]|nr:type II toxin-antitoxin system VapC family toxin [Okeania sp. SIO3B3]